MHCGGRDGGAGAMGPPPNEGGAGGSGNRRIRPGGCPRRMPVHYSTMGDQEGGEGATATGGGRITGGEEDEVRWRGSRCWWGCGGGGRQW